MGKKSDRPDRDPMKGQVDRLLRQLHLTATPGRPQPPVSDPDPRGGVTGAVRSATGRAAAAPPRRPSLLSRRAGGTPGRLVAVGRQLPTPLGVWGRVVLGLVLSVAMTQWPYPTCGLPLAGYMVAAATVLAAGVWAGRASWRRRMGVAHILAIGIILAGIAFGALEVLPRIGYAPVETAWRCLP